MHFKFFLFLPERLFCHDTYGPGIWLIGWLDSYPREEAQNVHIFDNVFYNTGTNPNIDLVGGIITSGFYDTLIENNTFDGVYHGTQELDFKFTANSRHCLFHTFNSMIF